MELGCKKYRAELAVFLATVVKIPAFLIFLA